MGSGSPRRRVERSRAEAPGARGGGRRRPAVCRAGAGGDLAKGQASRAEGGRPGSEPREQEVSEERWLVVCLVLLSEGQQWFGCNIQRSENMEAGFGEEKHRE